MARQYSGVKQASEREIEQQKQPQPSSREVPDSYLCIVLPERKLNKSGLCCPCKIPSSMQRKLPLLAEESQVNYGVTWM